MALNEEKNIPRLIESLKDCEEIIIADGGSSDKTVELAKSLSATVYFRNDKKYTPTQEDIDKFTKQFGYIPRFTTESSFMNASEIRNEVVTHAKNDWIFFPDADEFVTWDFFEIQKITEQCDQIECKLIHSRDGKYWNNISKLYNKKACSWGGKIHEVISGGRIIHSDAMKIDHYPNSKQGNVWAALEYNVLKDGDARSVFYLGREYYYYKEYQKSLDMFNRYMKVAWWRPEIAEAWLFMAKCCWEIQRGDDARQYCLKAISVNPDFKEALELMSEYTGEDQKEYWKRYADIATNHNVVFVKG